MEQGTWGYVLSVCLAPMPKLLIIAHVELSPRPLWSVILQAWDFWGPIAGCLVRGASTPQLHADKGVYREAQDGVGRGQGLRESAKILVLLGRGGGMMRGRKRNIEENE